MIRSMTGFAARECRALHFGKLCVELRSTNYKFMETVLHLPEGFLFLEESIKKIIESRMQRGRINCVVNFNAETSGEVSINKLLVKKYIKELSAIKKRFGIKGEISLDALTQLPGVLSLEEKPVSKVQLWPHLKALLIAAADELVKTRQKEGRALYAYLKARCLALQADLETVKTKFKKIIADKLRGIAGDEEKTAFLKDTDITEEIERLSFHVKNFLKKIAGNGPIGKELDFIAQEMQREANTMGAKSCDSGISARVVQIKSQIEKMREQVQNVE